MRNVYLVCMNNPAQLLGESSLGAGLRIGSVQLDGCAVLAPMSGVTDVGLRRIARRFGASLVVSEMVASDDFVRGHEVSRLRAEGAGLDVHVVQIAGREPSWMGEAARVAEETGASVVDINMGCPAKRVTGGYAGSALMRAPDHALRLIEATVKGTSLPVTLKMRLGWDLDCLNAPEIARRAQDAGVQLITIHGRTRNQFYKGVADWRAIRPVVEATRLPVVANGDCTSLADAHTMLAQSGAAGVMIGRAAMGRPWLVGEIASGLAGRKWREPTADQKRDAALEHLETLMATMGARTGLRHARKHLSAYAEHAGAPDALRLLLVTTDDPAQAIALLREAFLHLSGASLPAEAA
ncbi:MAG: tRNA dihydrouridine synthase DusB [Beijerinckiaceae bacterium]|nr:tRNA dihydrouridine synthase DusB [Beijerinckiaceae bacterium]